MKSRLRLVSMVGVVGIVALTAAGAGRANAPAGRYVVTADVVTDTKTGLNWRQAVLSAKTNQEAVAACVGLNTAAEGWRLPTLKELMTIVDETRTNPAMDPLFQAGPGTVYTSSSVIPGAQPTLVLHWGLNVKDGVTALADGGAVRCVRDTGTP